MEETIAMIEVKDLKDLTDMKEVTEMTEMIGMTEMTEAVGGMTTTTGNKVRPKRNLNHGEQQPTTINRAMQLRGHLQLTGVETHL